MITHENIIDIICECFNIYQYEIAQILNYDESVISKFKKGTYAQKKTSELKDRLHDEVFKRNINQGTETPEEQLKILKAIIEESYGNVKEDMSDYWAETDYDVFVKKLLALAQKNKKDSTNLSQQATGNKKSSSQDVKKDINRFTNNLDNLRDTLLKSYVPEKLTSLAPISHFSSNNNISDDNVIYQSTIAIDEKYMICQYCTRFLDLKDNNNPDMGKCSFSDNHVYKNAKSCISFDPKYGAISIAEINEKSPK